MSRGFTVNAQGATQRVTTTPRTVLEQIDSSLPAGYAIDLDDLGGDRRRQCERVAFEGEYGDGQIGVRNEGDHPGYRWLLDYEADVAGEDVSISGTYDTRQELEAAIDDLVDLERGLGALDAD